MLIYIIFVSLINSYTVNSVNICAGDHNSCACWDNNKDVDDYFGDIVDCSYYNGGQSILTADLILPSEVYSLDLSSNNITELVTSQILISSTLKKLFLNNNSLKEIHRNFLEFPNLEWIDLSYNKLEYIHKDAFEHVKSLEYLNLANNRLTSHDKLSFHRLTNLNEIILNDNNLGPSLQDNNLFDRNAYGLTHKIKSLGLRDVGLNEVPENFFTDAYDIRELDISENNIKLVFELPFTLEYLDLSDNPIEELFSEDFADLPALKVLKLNNLKINNVPEYAFDALQSLNELELERNKNLTVFSSRAFGHEVLDDPDDFVLEKLSLKGSRLTRLSKELAEPLGMLKSLNLQGNPWICDCDLVWLKSLQIRAEDYEHLRCGSPKSLFNGKVFELDAKYFTCPNSGGSDHHIALTVAVIGFSATLSAIALWFFVFIPKYQSRGNCISSVYTPSAAYTVLPVQSHSFDL